MAKEKKKAKEKEKKGKSKAAVALPAPAEREGTPVAGQEESYTLEQAAVKLGPGDAALEQALREGHADDELQAEGAKVASERILADGERLCSKALVHLGDPDPDVLQALRKVGLTRPIVALTVDALLRLKGAVVRGAEAGASGAENKAAATLTIEQATARGRQLREDMLGRLQLVQRADAQLSRAFAALLARPTTAERLTSQLEGLAALVRGVIQHSSDAVRALAASKGLDPEDADELDSAAEELHGAIARRVANDPTRRQQRQAVLDVLDGLCLLLIDDVLQALRAAHRRTPKIARPQIHTLASYFGSRGRGEPAVATPAVSPAAPAPGGG
jgi:hypothetical protein